MHTATVTGPDGGLLRAARQVVGGADSALLCVAFADVPGVRFLERELEAVAKRRGARLLATTVFGTTTPAALNVAHRLGVDVRVLNPGSGSTYHPKLYLGRGDERVEALVGSANLTRGLAVNVEAASRSSGAPDEAPLRELWDWAEDLWRDPRTERWQPEPDAGEDEAIDPELPRCARCWRGCRASKRNGDAGFGCGGSRPMPGDNLCTCPTRPSSIARARTGSPTTSSPSRSPTATR